MPLCAFILNSYYFTLSPIVLSSISTSTHSSSARILAFKELPKRAKLLGPSVEAWVKNLTMRSAMGNFVNGEIISHCILLAQEAFNENEFEVCAMFLDSVKTAVTIYPALAGSKEGFETLVELLNGSLAPNSAESKKGIKHAQISTMLTEILLAVTRSQQGVCVKDKGNMDFSTLKDDLIGICTDSGTAEQTKNAIHMLSSLVKGDRNLSPEQYVNDCKDVFRPILKKLTSPSRMKIFLNDGSGNEKVIDTFNALIPMTDCAPFLFSQDNGDLGSKALAFAKNILLENDSSSIDETGGSGKDSKDKSKDWVKGKRKRSSRNREPNVSILSLSCQTICCVIEFLVHHMRSTIIFSRNKSFLDSTPSEQHVKDIFGILVDLLQSGGVPRSNHHRQFCNDSVERAALRKCASLNLFRLCDSFLKLENKYLSTRMWHVLSKSFFDDDQSVRGACY